MRLAPSYFDKPSHWPSWRRLVWLQLQNPSSKIPEGNPSTARLPVDFRPQCLDGPTAACMSFGKCRNDGRVRTSSGAWAAWAKLHPAMLKLHPATTTPCHWPLSLPGAGAAKTAPLKQRLWLIWPWSPPSCFDSHQEGLQTHPMVQVCPALDGLISARRPSARQWASARIASVWTSDSRRAFGVNQASPH